MNEHERVDQVQEWWASNPMTYGSVHGRLDYADGEYQLGSLEFFDRVDREFYSWTKQMHSERPFDRLFPYKKYANQGRVLEVGCGLGTMAMNWAKNGANVTAVDLNSTSVEQTTRRFELHKLNGEVRMADARNLPFEDGTFDYGYSWGVLHHSPDLRGSIDELIRVVKPGGGFGIMLYNRNSILYRYIIQYIEGFLHYENRFLGPLELASRYGDGDRDEGNPHTWPITSTEAHEMLDRHSKNTEVRRFGNDLDGNLRFMLPFVAKYLPLSVYKSWGRRYGWGLWITGTKSPA
ncbi:MAG: class I SAM-dependent methyltransferase [Pyrinomonadaceae bacterium]